MANLTGRHVVDRLSGIIDVTPWDLESLSATPLLGNCVKVLLHFPKLVVSGPLRPLLVRFGTILG